VEGSDKPLEPIVQNDLLKITPVLLTPSASSQLPKEGLDDGGHPGEERPAKKQKIDEDTTTPKTVAAQ